MEFFKNRIVVKSTPENWKKESIGIKNNTVRSTFKLADMFSETNTMEDKEKNKDFEKMLEKMNQVDVERGNEKVALQIRNTEDGSVTEKLITDITLFRQTSDEAIFIISFKDL